MAKILVLLTLLCLVALCHCAPKKKKQPDCYSGVDYKFQYKVKVTVSGRTCQRWDADTPWNLTKISKWYARKKRNFPDKSIKAAENYCRNPDGDRRPWCYTTDKMKQREYCEMPLCKGLDKCYFKSLPIYKGTESKSKSGKTCLRWDSKEVTGSRYCKWYCGKPVSYPDKSIKDAKNYCRQPMARAGNLLYQPFCFTAAGKTEACNVKQCPTEKCGTYQINTYFASKGWRARIRIKVGKKRSMYVTEKTKESCAERCKKHASCNYWYWRGARGRNKKYHNRCYLLRNYYRRSEGYKGVASGPKNICKS